MIKRRFSCFPQKIFYRPLQGKARREERRISLVYRFSILNIFQVVAVLWFCLVVESAVESFALLPSRISRTRTWNTDGKEWSCLWVQRSLPEARQATG